MKAFKDNGIPVDLQIVKMQILLKQPIGLLLVSILTRERASLYYLLVLGWVDSEALDGGRVWGTGDTKLKCSRDRWDTKLK